MLLYSTAVFTSAGLLFLVQPLVGRLVLPLLGGTAAVWNTCMLFFQGMLLLGYVYAHYVPRRVGTERHMVLHLVLLAAAVAFLPIGIKAGWSPPPTGNPAPWLLLLLLVSVGAPFVLISATAPLVQSWFVRTGHKDAGDPYFLYAASNLGSIVALLGYPLVVEPALRLGQQRFIWSAGYLGLIAMLAACALRARRNVRPPVAEKPLLDDSRPTVATRVRWLALALVPSSLLLALTTYLTTDIAPVPLLWVVPLVLYLLTFVLAFARRSTLPHPLMVRLQLPLIACLVALLFWDTRWVPAWTVPIHLLVFFVTGMVCHGELARTRPGARHLTEFYLWISIGGALGGAFNALVAPILFDSLVELPLLLVAACVIRPVMRTDARPWWWSAMALVVVGVTAGLMLTSAQTGVDETVAWNLRSVFLTGALVLTVTGAALWIQLHRTPVLLAVGAAALLYAGHRFETSGRDVLLTERNFYGEKEVRAAGGGDYHVFMHGTTTHGAQHRDPQGAREPISYYSTTGPVGDVFRAFPARAGRRVAVIGLGVGTIAAYGGRGEHWTFYEIDPAVERIARDPRYFTYLRDAAPSTEVVTGDGRLTIAQAPDEHYDLIVVDAFSSDAVPVHLLTREAMQLYFRKLAPEGVLLYNLSNRYLVLAPFVGSTARSIGAVGRIRGGGSSQDPRDQAYYAEWAAIAGSEQHLGPLWSDPAWSILPASRAAWTDDHSNVLSALRLLQ